MAGFFIHHVNTLTAQHAGNSGFLTENAKSPHYAVGVLLQWKGFPGCLVCIV